MVIEPSKETWNGQVSCQFLGTYAAILYHTRLMRLSRTDHNVVYTEYLRMYSKTPEVDSRYNIPTSVTGTEQTPILVVSGGCKIETC